MNNYVLTLSCRDQVGVVAAVSQCIAQYSGWIISASQYADPPTGIFFMRVEIKASSLAGKLEKFRQAFEAIAAKFQMTWRLSDAGINKKVIIMASQQDHCLADLLYRMSRRDLQFTLLAVISNHATNRRLVENYDIPYHHVPFTANKEEIFTKVASLLKEYQPDVIILARFMQILPISLCQDYAGKIINIHHSFLPSFIGADSYAQALERGVKLIGATCHYVTEELDQGPIIEQDVVRVTHQHSLEELKRLGRDVERQVLARGLRYHLEDRAIIHSNKTIILE